MQPGGAAQRLGVPGVVAAGGEHRRRVGSGGGPDAGPDVAHRARVLKQHDRSGAGLAPGRPDVDGRTAGDRDDAGAGRVRHRSFIAAASTGALRSASEPTRSGASSAASRSSSADIHRNCLDHVGAEAQGVLERVKALQQGESRVAAGGAVALNNGVAHRPIMPVFSPL